MYRFDILNSRCFNMYILYNLIYISIILTLDNQGTTFFILQKQLRNESDGDVALRSNINRATGGASALDQAVGGINNCANGSVRVNEDSISGRDVSNDSKDRSDSSSVSSSISTSSEGYEIDGEQNETKNEKHDEEQRVNLQSISDERGDEVR